MNKKDKESGQNYLKQKAFKSNDLKAVNYFMIPLGL